MSDTYAYFLLGFFCLFFFLFCSFVGSTSITAPMPGILQPEQPRQQLSAGGRRPASRNSTTANFRLCAACRACRRAAPFGWWVVGGQAAFPSRPACHPLGVDGRVGGILTYRGNPDYSLARLRAPPPPPPPTHHPAHFLHLHQRSSVNINKYRCFHR